jgi:hypothetical protein
MNKHLFKYIENEMVYGYYDVKKEIRELESDIINATVVKNEIRTTDINDPTYYGVVRLGKDVRREYLKRIVISVDIVWINLGEDQRGILSYKYWKNPRAKWETVADLFYVSRKTLYNWRSSVMKEIGIRMGVEG